MCFGHQKGTVEIDLFANKPGAADISREACYLIDARVKALKTDLFDGLENKRLAERNLDLVNDIVDSLDISVDKKIDGGLL